LKRVPIDAERVQLIQSPELVRQVADVVVEEIQLFHISAHADLGGQFGNVVVRRLQKPELSQLANTGRDSRQFVRCDVQLRQELVLEKGRRQHAEALAAHVDIVPVLASRLVVDAPRTPPLLLRTRGGLISVISRTGLDHSLVLAGLETSIVMRLAVRHHGSVGPLSLFVQPQLFGPVFGNLLGLTPSSGRPAVAILHAVGRERARVGEDAAGVGGVLVDDIGGDAVTAVVALDRLMVLGMGLLVLMGLLLVVAVQHGQPTLPRGRAIQTVVVPLLVVLAVHAS